jgi:hypothetical protein
MKRIALLHHCMISESAVCLRMMGSWSTSKEIYNLVVVLVVSIESEWRANRIFNNG